MTNHSSEQLLKSDKRTGRSPHSAVLKTGKGRLRSMAKRRKQRLNKNNLELVAPNTLYKLTQKNSTTAGQQAGERKSDDGGMQQENKNG